MTREEIMQLTGRELDVAVAERVMGWKRGDPKYGDMPWYPPGTGRYLGGGRMNLPKFSTDIAAAWEVVEWMHEFGVQMWAGYDSDGNPFAAYNDGDCHPYLSADTVPQAICRLALMAVSERSEATDGGDGGQSSGAVGGVQTFS